MHRHISIIALIALLSFSCNTPTDNRIVQIESDTSSKGRIIPYYEYSAVKNASDQVLFESIARTMGLPDMMKIREVQYIRIWLWDNDKKYIVNFSQEKSSNKCQIVEWNSIKKDSAEYFIIHRDLKNVQPKSGWENLWAAVDKYRITSLQSGKSWEQQERHLTHMASVEFEIARPGYYRFYEYLEPAFYRYIDDGSMNVYEFLKYLNSELGIQVYNPAEKLYVEPK